MINKFISLILAGYLIIGFFPHTASGLDIHSVATNIPHTPKLKPASSFKTAAVCFAGSGGCGQNATFTTGDENMTLDTGKLCKEAGYSYNTCNAGRPVSPCPYDKNYNKGCQCPDEFTACSDVQSGSGKSCVEKGITKYERCSCKSTLITCSDVQNGIGESCSGKYASCQCKPGLIACSGNQIGVGKECNGKYVSCKCPDNWKICENGGDSGAKKCTDGGIEYWSSCKQCDCPSGYSETCSDTQKFTASNDKKVCDKTCHKCVDCSSSYKYNAQNCPGKLENQCGSNYSRCVLTGYFYNADGSYTANPGVKPIGVVYYNTDGEYNQPAGKRKRLILALKEIRANWADSAVDIPAIPNVNNCSDEASNSFKGKQYTAAAAAHASANGYSAPAIDYVRNYFAGGTKVGDWYMPSYKEFYFLGDSTRRALVQNALGKVSGAAPLNETTWYWTSTEDNEAGFVCSYKPGTGNQAVVRRKNQQFQGQAFIIRPVLMREAD